MALSDARPHASAAEIRLLKAQLLKLAIIAAISQHRFLPFAEAFLVSVSGAWHLGKDWQASTLSDAAKPLRRFEHAASECAKAVLALNPSVRRLLPFDRALETASEAVNLAVQARALQSIKTTPAGRRGPRSKRMGEPGFPALDMFVWSTLTHVHRAGGKLTLDKNHHGGSLLVFLNALRAMRLLPDGFIPERLPIGRLGRLKRDWTRIWRGVRDTDPVGRRR